MPQTEESASFDEFRCKERHYVRWDLTTTAKFSTSTTLKAQPSPLTDRQTRSSNYCFFFVYETQSYAKGLMLEQQCQVKQI